MNQKPLSNEQVRSLVLQLTEYSENEYNDMVIVGADEYLRENLRPQDDQALLAMRKSKSFWKWWVHQWDRRSRILLHNIGYNESTRLCREERFTLREMFINTHSADSITVYPNRVVMDDTYAIMIGEFHDELHRQKEVRND